MLTDGRFSLQVQLGDSRNDRLNAGEKSQTVLKIGIIFILIYKSFLRLNLCSWHYYVLLKRSIVNKDTGQLSYCSNRKNTPTLVTVNQIGIKTMRRSNRIKPPVPSPFLYPVAKHWMDNHRVQVPEAGKLLLVIESDRIIGGHLGRSLWSLLVDRPQKSVL